MISHVRLFHKTLYHPLICAFESWYCIHRALHHVCCLVLQKLGLQRMALTCSNTSRLIMGTEQISFSFLCWS